MTARLSDGSTTTADYVVGADGIRSRTRAQLGLDAEPRYAGQMVWRALVPRPGWVTAVHTFAGPSGTTGIIPISGEQAYVFLTESAVEARPAPESELAERMRDLLAPFGGRFTEIRDTITDRRQVVRRPVHTVFVEGPWHAGRGVLAGDAAHAPSPQMVSGAALAVEDAVVLTCEISDHAGEPAKAFEAYQHRRYERARAVVETSVEIGRRERQGRHHEVRELQQSGHAAMAAPI